MMRRVESFQRPGVSGTVYKPARFVPLLIHFLTWEIYTYTKKALKRDKKLYEQRCWDCERSWHSRSSIKMRNGVLSWSPELRRPFVRISMREESEESMSIVSGSHSPEMMGENEAKGKRWARKGRQGSSLGDDYHISVVDLAWFV